jgi:hypothetical protein
MFRTQHCHHHPEKRRQPGGVAGARRAVRPGHVFAWEFGGMLEHGDYSPAVAPDASERAMRASLDKALALAG